MMNAGLQHMKQIAERLGGLATALATRIPHPAGQGEMVKGVAHALGALARQLTPEERLTVRGIEVHAAYDAQAAALLMADRELVNALTQAGPRAVTTSYIYLRAFHQWNAEARGRAEETRHREFGLALIVAGLFLTSRYAESHDYMRPALEEAAYRVLGYDPALREVLPTIREAYDRAAGV